MNPPTPSDQLDDMRDYLYDILEILHIAQSRGQTREMYESGIIDALIAWRDTQTAEAVRAGYDLALFDVGYGYHPIKNLDSVEKRRAELGRQPGSQ